MPVSRRRLLGLGGLAVAGGAAAAASAQGAGRVREHWIAARPARWPVTAASGHHGSGRREWLDALVYVACTPRWERPLPARGIGDNAGIPGPVLRAEPGDLLRVHFRNEDRRRARTIHPHGLSYGPEHDGTWMGRGTPRGGAVPPGGTHTYEWLVFDSSVGVWPYHDHGPHEMDGVARGLFGAIVVTRRDEPAADVEHTLVMHHVRGLACFNGRAFAAATPRPRARAGQEVAFNVLALGDPVHTFHVHGHRWRRPDGTPEDAALVGPSQGVRLRWREDAPGRWLYHCHMPAHMHHGMTGVYEVGRPA